MIEQLQTYFSQFQSPELLSEMQDIAMPKKISETVTLLHPGDSIQGIPLVLSGNIRVIRNDPSGKEILLYHIAPGETCIMSVFACKNDTPSEIWAVADAYTELLFIPSKFVNLWQTQFHDWRDYILTLYHQRFEELIQVVSELAFKRVDERLLEWLTTRTKLKETQLIEVTHQQIADELGTAREVVSRLLKQLEQEGEVRLGRGKIEVLRF